MQILKGTVATNKDTSKSGKIWVLLDIDKSNAVQVIYTSPFFNRFNHGIIAIPNVYSQVLVAYDGKNYYYLSTVVDYHDEFGSITTDGVGKPASIFGDPKVYDSSGVPSKMEFKNDKDAGLTLTTFYENKKPIVNDVTLRSSQGNELVLSDSPKQDVIMLKNKHGDGITIAGGASTPFANRCIQIKTQNSHVCTVAKGEYSVTVSDGRDVTIRNDSTGKSAIYIPPLPILGPPPVGSTPILQYGNINLISKFRDINIYTDVPDAQVATLPRNFSNIYISTNQGMVQINSNGDVKIFSKTGRVTVQSLGDINLVSNEGSINLQAAAGINLNTLANININATQNLNAQGVISTNLGSGSPLHLNKLGGAIPAPPQPIPPELPRLNVYGK